MSENLQDNSGEQIQAAAVPETVNATQQAEQERQVPLSALESERARRQQMEDENRLMKEHLTLMQARPPASAPPKDELDGLDDSDVMTVGDFKKMSGKIANQFQMTLEELRMTQKYPDYQTVITKYLPEVLKTNPNLKSSLQKSQDYELAYYLAKESEAYRSQNKKAQRNEDAERIMKNTQQTGSLSSMGASTPVAQAKRYKDMSDSEFNALMHKNLGY